MTKKILLIGGTGVIGESIVEYLSSSEHSIYVTTRQKRQSFDNVQYIVGNGKDDDFLKEIIVKFEFDAIIDFMHYSTPEFERKLTYLLDEKRQYVFLSSVRIYDNVDVIVEESQRITKGTKDEKYLNSNEYAIEKIAQENLLKKFPRKFWTIVRPSITFGRGRFQLGTFEADIILNRASYNLPVCLPPEILNRKTTMTRGSDTAKLISSLLFNHAAFGNDFNVLTDESITWREVAEVYEEVLGLVCKEVTLADYMKIEGNKWQVKYDRVFDRVCDNTKALNQVPLNSRTLCEVRQGLRAELLSLTTTEIGSTISRKNGHIDKVLGIYRLPRGNYTLKSLVLYLCGRFDFLDRVFLKIKG